MEDLPKAIAVVIALSILPFAVALSQAQPEAQVQDAGAPPPAPAEEAQMPDLSPGQRKELERLRAKLEEARRQGL